MADNRWADIYKLLKSNKVNVYSPGTKNGECTSRYVVVKYDGSAQHGSLSTDDDFYSVMCFVPKEEYSTLLDFVNEIERYMKKLEPMIKPTHQKTPSFYDDSVKAHMISITYKNYRKC